MEIIGPLLAIESSCDDCAAAIVTPNGQLLSEVVNSQTDTHAPFGGIVPEHASRQHLATIASVVQAALAKANLKPSDLGAVAVTYGPGLVGSLIVGVQFARGFAKAAGKPLVGVHHIEGHLFAARSEPGFPTEPFIGLVASGGHSALYLCKDDTLDIEFLGETRDDAAGEAYDKAAKLLGFGYPGGHLIDALAQNGDPKAFAFPIALRSLQSLEFSFSGVKTAFRNKLTQLKAELGTIDEVTTANLCASLQSAIVTALVDKSILACKQKQVKHLVIGGGVACNSLLRSQATLQGQDNGIEVFLTPKRHCTDNAAMIAQAALRRISKDEFPFKDFSVQATSEIGHP